MKGIGHPAAGRFRSRRAPAGSTVEAPQNRQVEGRLPAPSSREHGDAPPGLRRRGALTPVRSRTRSPTEAGPVPWASWTMSVTTRRTQLFRLESRAPLRTSRWTRAPAAGIIFALHTISSVGIVWIAPRRATVATRVLRNLSHAGSGHSVWSPRRCRATGCTSGSRGERPCGRGGADAPARSRPAPRLGGGDAHDLGVAVDDPRPGSRPTPPHRRRGLAQRLLRSAGDRGSPRRSGRLRRRTRRAGGSRNRATSASSTRADPRSATSASAARSPSRVQAQGCPAAPAASLPPRPDAPSRGAASSTHSSRGKPVWSPKTARSSATASLAGLRRRRERRS